MRYESAVIPRWDVSPMSLECTIGLFLWVIFPMQTFDIIYFFNFVKLIYFLMLQDFVFARLYTLYAWLFEVMHICWNAFYSNSQHNALKCYMCWLMWGNVSDSYSYRLPVLLTNHCSFCIHLVLHVFDIVPYCILSLFKTVAILIDSWVTTA